MINTRYNKKVFKLTKRLTQNKMKEEYQAKNKMG